MFSNLTPTDIFAVIVTIIISLVIHEYMHGYVAHLLGDSTASDEGRLSFNPLRHIDPYSTVLLPIITLVIFHFPFLAAKPVPFNPNRLKYNEFGSAMVAAAGPLTNLVLAIVGSILARHVFVDNNFLGIFFAYFTYLNVILFAFNFLPIPPLDGSRVLYAFAPESVQRVMVTVEPYGIFIVFALLLSSGLGNVLVNIDQSVLNLLP